MICWQTEVEKVSEPGKVVPRNFFGLNVHRKLYLIGKSVLIYGQCGATIFGKEEFFESE